ncbi:hypothetical protein KC318_g2853 [Hortaea werneckii]|nr:hypothetical protein KC334_g4114 [Hortaea werneckii]KAI7017059.1 hypothetical protein KC355_g3787 [Hortaea werneckii]KAI7198464.1 hypothetical protein KC324_g3770 [Hortaea werneckii]KAI7595007.1 hypothetical protein KC316_g802 [Hortaea werneckii]KAI7672482.1 hypothetical protein KC318_g2853 [Hortaea werneckii]
MPPKTCNVSDTAFLLSCLKHVNGKIDTAAVGEECGGMTVNAVVKKIKRMKEIEARQPTSTDGDVRITDSVDDNKAADCETTKKRAPQKAGRVEKRKPVKRPGAGNLLAKIKDEDSDQ